MRLVDLTGKRFGRLLVIRQNGRSVHKEVLWLCLCDCRKRTTVRSQNLITGKTKSCGCYRKEATVERSTKHGKSYHPLYSVWRSMRKRCGIIKGAAAHEKRDYINRGITVCEKWANNFQSFYDFSIIHGWRKGLTIDRKNTNGNYTPENCRFVPHKINNQNTRASRRWFIDNKKYNSVYEAAKILGVHPMTIHSWCCGRKTGKYYYPPKPNCYAINLY